MWVSGVSHGTCSVNGNCWRSLGRTIMPPVIGCVAKRWVELNSLSSVSTSTTVSSATVMRLISCSTSPPSTWTMPVTCSPGRTVGFDRTASTDAAPAPIFAASFLNMSVRVPTRPRAGVSPLGVNGVRLERAADRRADQHAERDRDDHADRSLSGREAVAGVGDELRGAEQAEAARARAARTRAGRRRAKAGRGSAGRARRRAPPPARRGSRRRARRRPPVPRSAPGRSAPAGRASTAARPRGALTLR